jgi:outer membrane protein TolC
MKKDSERCVKKRWWTSSCTAFWQNRRQAIATAAALILLPGWSGAELSLTLPEAIGLSREHSFQVKASRHDSLAAARDYKAARAERFPTLSLDAVSYHINEIQTLDFPFGQTIEIGTKDNYQIDVRFSLPLFTGGKISSLIKAQKHNERAESHRLEAESFNAAYQARRAYLRLMLTEKIDASAEASVKRIKIVEENVRHLYAGGLADSLDLLEAELAYQKAAQELETSATARKTASLSLTTVLGLPPDTVIRPTETIPVPVEPDQAPESPELSVERAELKALESRIRSAREVAGLRKSDYFPNISGYVGYSAGKPNRDFFNNEWNDYLTAGAVLNWTFNSGLKTIHRVRSARHLEFSARMAKKKMDEAFVLQARIAGENLKLAYRTFIISSKEYEIARRKYRLAEEKQKAGRMTVNRLLELEAELTTAEKLYQASMVNYHLARSDYLFAVGSPNIYGGL